MDSAPAAPQPDPSPQSQSQEPMLHCPACDARLEQHRCKLVCPRCGYYMSCSDYY